MSLDLDQEQSQDPEQHRGGATGRLDLDPDSNWDPNLDCVDLTNIFNSIFIICYFCFGAKTKPSSGLDQTQTCPRAQTTAGSFLCQIHRFKNKKLTTFFVHFLNFSFFLVNLVTIF